MGVKDGFQRGPEETRKWLKVIAEDGPTQDMDFTIGLLNAQLFSKGLRKVALNHFKATGEVLISNFYYTPSRHGQGLAFHADTCPLATLQIEGKKNWHFPQDKSGQFLFDFDRNETLSKAINRSFMRDLQVPEVLEIELVPGELLYVPLGAIHKAVNQELSASAHVTFEKDTFNNRDFFNMLSANVCGTNAFLENYHQKIELEDVFKKFFDAISQSDFTEKVVQMKERLILQKLKNGKKY